MVEYDKRLGIFLMTLLTPQQEQNIIIGREEALSPPWFPWTLLSNVNTCFIFFYFLFQLNSPAVLPLLHLYFEVEVNNKDKGKEGEFSMKTAYPCPSTETQRLFISTSLSLIFNMFVTFSPPLQQWHCSRSSPIVLKYSLLVKLLLLSLARRHDLFWG